MTTHSAQSQLLARDQRHLIHPLHNPAAHKSGVVWTGGRGAILTDADGKEYLDGLSGLWCNSAGNGREELARAMSRAYAEVGAMAKERRTDMRTAAFALAIQRVGRAAMSRGQVRRKIEL